MTACDSNGSQRGTGYPPSLVVREYSLVHEALRSPHFTVTHPFRATRQLFGPTAIDVDGARHRELRSHVAWFSAAQVVKWQESAVVPVVSDLVLALPPGESVDFMNLAHDLPTRVILRVLGCSDADVGWVWERLVPVIHHISYPGNPVEAVTACTELGEYVQEKLAGTPPSGVLSWLMEKAAQQSRDVVRTTVRTTLLLLAAGTATTAGAAGNLMVALLRHPGLWGKLRSREVSPSGVVRETLRLLPPVQRTIRFATSDTVLGSVPVARGSVVELDLAAANRDPSVFECPLAFRPGRQSRPLMSFGAGQHTCAGALLATSELESLLTALTARFNSLSAADGNVMVTKGTVFQQPDRLDLIFA